MERIPDEIMNEAKRLYYVSERNLKDDATLAIARALMARDQRAAEIARTFDNRTGHSVADAILAEAGEEER